MKRKTPAVTTEPPTPSFEPVPDQKIEDIPTVVEHTRKEVRAATVAPSANTDVTGRSKQEVAEAKDRIPEKTIPTTDVLVENGPTAQSTARDGRAFRAASVKPTVIAELIATAAVVVVGVVKLLRRR